MKPGPKPTLPQAREPGVYAITNRVNGKRYVGSAVNLLNRLGTHRKALRVRQEAGGRVTRRAGRSNYPEAVAHAARCRRRPVSPEVPRMLLAETEASVGGGVIGAVISAVLCGITYLMTTRHSQDRQDKQDLKDGLWELIESLKADRNLVEQSAAARVEAAERRARAAEREVADCARDRAVQNERIGFLEDALDAAGIKFRRRPPGNDSSTHTPLPAGGPPPGAGPDHSPGGGV